MSRKDNETFAYTEKHVGSETTKLTHKRLMDALEAILFREDRMVVITRSYGNKPLYHYSSELNAANYLKKSDRLAYIEQITGQRRADILLPVTEHTLELYATKLKTTSLQDISNAIYSQVTEENKRLNYKVNRP